MTELEKAIMAVLWKQEQWNGVGPDYDTYRKDGPNPMNGIVEAHEAKARILAEILKEPVKEIRRRFEYASSMYHNVEYWHGEQAPDGSDLYEWFMDSFNKVLTK